MSKQAKAPSVPQIPKLVKSKASSPHHTNVSPQSYPVRSQQQAALNNNKNATFTSAAAPVSRIPCKTPPNKLQASPSPTSLPFITPPNKSATPMSGSDSSSSPSNVVPASIVVADTMVPSIYTVSSDVSVREFLGKSEVAQSPEFSFSPGTHARKVAELKKSPVTPDVFTRGRCAYQSQAQSESTVTTSSTDTKVAAPRPAADNTYGNKFALNSQFGFNNKPNINMSSPGVDTEAVTANNADTSSNMDGVEVSGDSGEVQSEATPTNYSDAANTTQSNNFDVTTNTTGISESDFNFSSQPTNPKLLQEYTSANIEEQQMDFEVTPVTDDGTMVAGSEQHNASSGFTTYNNDNNYGSFGDMNPTSPATEASPFDFSSFDNVKSPADAEMGGSMFGFGGNSSPSPGNNDGVFSFNSSVKSPDDGSSNPFNFSGGGSPGDNPMSSGFSFGGGNDTSPGDSASPFGFGGGGVKSPEDGSGNPFSFGDGAKSPEEKNGGPFSFSF